MARRSFPRLLCGSKEPGPVPVPWPTLEGKMSCEDALSSPLRLKTVHPEKVRRSDEQLPYLAEAGLVAH
jgi:hypothetical protein